MINVFGRLHIGTCEDYENNKAIMQGEDWFIVAACKEPYHRAALGYKSKGAPKDSHEYLLCYRDNMLILNLVDVADPAWVSKEIIDTAIENMVEAYLKNKNILIFCNQGKSRSAIIAMLFLQRIGAYVGLSFEEAEAEFISAYPKYEPNTGMLGYAKEVWSKESVYG